jgi:hypothetical protein
VQKMLQRQRQKLWNPILDQAEKDLELVKSLYMYSKVSEQLVFKFCFCIFQ